MKIHITPLSVNEAYTGRRFKTEAHRRYRHSLMWLLPTLTIPEGKLKISLVVGYSNDQSDVDNFVKPFVDALQERYKFNDKRVYRLEVEKQVVAKGSEFIDFTIETYHT